MLRYSRLGARRRVDLGLTQDDPARALHSPFTLPDDWDPIPGTCSRCGRDAWCDEGRWWHDGDACPPTRAAEFLPDPM